jgi:signal transduction histidine kinase
MALLVGVLLAISALVVLVPGFPVGAPNALLAVAMATLESTIGLMLLLVQLLRFSSEGRLLDLFAAFAFGALALASLIVRVFGLITGLALVRPEISTLVLLVAQVIAVGLFLAGLVLTGRTIVASQRPAITWRAASLVILTASVGIVLVLGIAVQRLTVLDQRAEAQLANSVTVTNFLTGQDVWLMLLDGGCTLLMFIAAIGYAHTWRRPGGSDVGLTAATLIVLSFGQFHALLFPPVALQYVTVADGLRLVAYLGALGGLVMRLGDQIAERASREERLRLSRELHDGLAQQLSLLQLRLGRSAVLDRPAEARARDLEIAQRLTESALMEARQAITILRSGSVSWEHFIGVIASFADEFANNHEVEVRVESQGAMREVDLEFQGDVLHILQEAFSNAIRHGTADRLRVTLSAEAGWCGLTILDNGRGFELTSKLARTGVGLDSMVERLQRRGGRFSIDSTLGLGTTVRAWLPRSGQNGP